MNKPPIKNQDIDDEDFEENQSDMECQICGGEYPDGCICYIKSKMPVWINSDL